MLSGKIWRENAGSDTKTAPPYMRQLAYVSVTLRESGEGGVYAAQSSDPRTANSDCDGREPIIQAVMKLT